MYVSGLEVYFLAQDILLQAGVAQGCAAAGARMVLWAEIHHGTGLTTLHGQLDLLGPGPPALGLEDSAQWPWFVALDGDAGSTLVAGPPALDLACALAAEHGFGAIYVRDSGGLPFVGELCERAGQRGLACLVTVSAAAAEATSSEAGRSFVGVPGPGGPVYVEMPVRGAARTHVALAGMAAGKPPRAAIPLHGGDSVSVSGADLLRGGLSSASPTPPGPAGVGIVCVRAGDAALASLRDEVLQQVVGPHVGDAPSVQTAAQRSAAVEAAYRTGIWVEDRLWLDLTAVAYRMLVPTTERSRREGTGELAGAPPGK